jgi:hypothetical protein
VAGKPKYSEVTCTSATLANTYATLDLLWARTPIDAMKAADCLSYDVMVSRLVAGFPRR